MIKKEFKDGFLVYRKPNVAEKFILLGEVGLSQKDIERFKSNQSFFDESPLGLIFIGKMLQNVGKFVKEVKVTRDGKELTNYNDLLDDGQYIETLMQVGYDLIGDEEVPLEKK